ncbi:MAG TPA: CU044_5270 family protein [Streptomyces sp.]|uniref:CU044_5270 family protein n=1 Tax=Streptomyces sp. TaxID=1931 RepID=UPI002D36AE36|nr:CU044_5270 family protein [Streptomyces sp.]HZG06654.1 CU044_5270 family protein [Streptomyces sp.]
MSTTPPPPLSPSEQRLLHALTDVVDDRRRAAPPAQPARSGNRSGAGVVILRRRTLVGLAAAAAVATVAVPAMLPTGPGDGLIAGANASAFLGEMSATVAAQPAPPRDAPFWYVKSRSRIGDERAGIREEWFGRRVAGGYVQSGPDGSSSNVAPGPATWVIGFSGQTMTWDQLQTLPTDPTALAAVLRRASTVPGSDPGSDPGSNVDTVFGVIGELLTSPAPPKVKAALYAVAARVPGVRLVGTVIDDAGRSGVAVEQDGSGQTTRYVIDRRTGSLLTETNTPLGPCTPGPVTGLDGRTIPDTRGRTVRSSCLDKVYTWTYLQAGPATTLGRQVTPSPSPSPSDDVSPSPSPSDDVSPSPSPTF